MKARGYAGIGEPELCRRYTGMAEDALASAVAADAAADGWQATMATPAHLHTLTGHAAASLAHRTDAEPDRAEAIRRLTAAVEALDVSTHPRMFVLCAVRLAVLHLTDQPEPATTWAKQAIELATHLRSGRVGRAIGALRAVAAACGPGPAAGVVELIDAHRQHRTQRDRLIRIQPTTIRTGIDPTPTSAAGTSTVDATGEQEGQRS